MTRVVSLTPAVFHLSDAVNQVSRTYGENPIVPRGPRLKPLIDKVRHGIQAALGAPNHEPVLLTGSGSTAMAAVLGSCLRPDERLLVIRNGAYGNGVLEYANTLKQPVIDMELSLRPAPRSRARGGALRAQRGRRGGHGLRRHLDLHAEPRARARRPRRRSTARSTSSTG